MHVMWGFGRKFANENLKNEIVITDFSKTHFGNI